ncbi:LADA_0F03400g1_1 [Lachancea dasiensis]|uniref:LADA_0F03400g1_1 n=1 Tax=Lachancea dasiensis TaxID=1072105 RepID=A0A1G4JJ54_9SACH|nr:LADA_0F03400g1_1 [Lachancea dasiensis]
MQNEFKKVPLTSNQDFSWAFLIDWVLILSVSILAAFYFGRAFGFIITTLLEWFVWKRYSVKIQVHSLKISFLGGRLFFKNLTVVTENQTISVLQGHLTWRYWLFNSRQTSYERAQCGATGSDNRPCRFKFECQGLEHFIYNKTHAFHHVKSSLSTDEQARFREFDEFNEDGHDSFHNNASSTQSSTLASDDKNASSSTESSLNHSSLPLPPFLRSLPLEFDVQKGAIVVGNKHTTSILILNYDSLHGVLDVGIPNNKLDLYKMQTRIEFNKFRASLRPNLAFSAVLPLQTLVRAEKLKGIWHKSIQVLLKAKDGRFYDLYPRNSDPHHIVQNPLEEWKGLGLYRKEDDAAWDDAFKFDVSKHQYAKYTKLVKSEKLVVDYSFDSPGVTPSLSSHAASDSTKQDEADRPPDFSVDIKLFGATIHYGPWSHNELLPIQKMFSPVISRDSRPLDIPKAGSKRDFVRSKLSVTVASSSILRIPTREASKDLDFLKRFRETQDDSRPFGWLEIVLAKGSELTLDFAMCPTSSGFENILDLHMEEPELRTSVNHDILFSAVSHDVHAQIGYPLGWNQMAEWKFDLASDQAQFFILKDHIHLLADMISDFGSGEPTPYDLFRPFIYEFTWNFRGYSIYLNVNDANIVNNPVDFNENSYLSFHGDDLRMEFTVPQLSVAGNSTTVDYKLFTSMFRLRINTPTWSTLHEFMKDQEVGRCHDFTMSGSYLFYSKLDVDNTDTIIIDCQSRSTTLKCYGFVVRFLIGVKMNYFGDFAHFKTTEEYMEELRGASVGRKTASAAIEDFLGIIDSCGRNSQSELPHLNRDAVSARKSSLKRMVNEKDVWFTFSVRDGCIALPEQLYDCESCFAFQFDSLDIDVRDLNYYMDLQASFSPIEFRRLSTSNSDGIFGRTTERNAESFSLGQASDLHIHAHRLFGLPPDEETYVCKWDFALGSLKIESDLSFILQLTEASKKLIFGFKDFENIMNYESTNIFDLTSVTFVTDEMTLSIQDTLTMHEISVETKRLKMTFVDMENEAYSSRVDVDLALLLISIVEKEPKEKLIGLFKTSGRVTNFLQLADLMSHTKKQKAHIAANDAPFHRCPFLLPGAIQNSATYRELFGSIPPGVSIPSVAIPVTTANWYQEMIEFMQAEKDLDRVSWGEFFSNGIGTSPIAACEGSNQPPLSSTIKLPIHMDEADYDSEFSNLVMSLDYAVLKCNPHCHQLLESLMSQQYSNFVEQLMDANEMNVVLYFIKKAMNIKESKRFKILSPQIEIILGEYLDEHDALGNFTSAKICLRGLNLNAGLKEKVDASDPLEDFDVKRDQEITALVKIPSLKVDVWEQNHSSSSIKRGFVFSSAINELEAWFLESEKNNASINVSSVDNSMNPNAVETLLIFAKGLINDFDKLFTISSQFDNLKNEARKDFFYHVAMASEEYQIMHDPPVITKPAYITRVPNQHVRENRSWKIVTRLRHILNYLPEPLVADLYATIKKRTLIAPANAGTRFLEVFSKWRSWEFFDVEKCFFYRKSFGQQLGSENGASEFNVKVGLGVISYTLSNATDEDGDTIILKDIIALHTCEGNPAGAHQDAPREKSLSLTIKTARIVVSETALNLNILLEAFSSQDARSFDFTQQQYQSLAFEHMSFMIDRCEVQLISRSEKLSFKSFGNCATFGRQQSGSKVVSFITSWDWLELGLRHHNNVLLDVFSRNGSLTTVLASVEDGTSSVFDFQSRKLRLKSHSTTESYCGFISSVERLQNVLRSRIDVNQQVAAASSTHDPKGTASMRVRVKVSHFAADIAMITPLSFSIHATELDTIFEQAGGQEIQINLGGIDLEVGSSKRCQQYLKWSQSRLELRSNLVCGKNASNTITVESELSKLEVCEPKSLFTVALEDYHVAKQSLHSLDVALRALQLHGNKESDDRATSFPGVWNISLKAKYAGVLLSLGASSYILELNQLLFNLSGKDHHLQNDSRKGDHIQGEIWVNSMAFLINDSQLSAGLAKLIDIGLGIKVAQESEGIVKSLEIESSHFRIAICPVSVIKVLLLALEISNFASTLAPREHSSTDDPGTLAGILKALGAIQSIHILSYNFCVGWMFDVVGATHPGLIWGYQRVFAAHEWPHGKLTLLDAYFSMARGYSSDDFYATDSEVNKFNRSFLPSTQICYWFGNVNCAEELFVRVTGERLDVSFLSKAIGLAEGLLKSVQEFEDLKRTQLDPLLSSVKESGRPSSPSKPIKIPGFFGIKSLNCVARYAGGVFKLYSPEDVNSGIDPSFQLESPSVEVIFDYRNTPCDRRSHKLRVLAHVDRSHNTIFPTCVPLLGELARDVRCLMKSFNVSSENTSSVSNVQDNINYKNLLRDFDISFQTNVQQQLISLSCEPKAKVQADIGFDKLVIKLFTNDLDVLEPLSVSVDIRNIMATSRHIFSREISTSIKIDQLRFVFFLTHPDVIHTYGIVHIPSIDVYFNIKQLQDLNVFINIWKVDSEVLSQREMAGSSPSYLSAEGSLTAKHKKVTSNSSFPWNFVMVISKIKGDIDLGVSLGVLSLSTDRMWAVTDHYSNWTQKLSLRLERVSLSSDGRLGGTLLLRNLNWMSQVSWPVHGGELQNPLIIINIALEEFALKLSFDYHLILIASLENFRTNLFNKRDPAGLSRNLMSVSVFCENTHIFATALAPANLLDVYNTILRMRKDNKKSYLETLGDSNTKDTKQVTTSREILSSLSFLRTELDVKLSFFNAQIFPSTLFDMEVLTFKAANLSSSSQIERHKTLKTQLSWQIHDVKIALSTFKSQLHEKAASQIGVKEYIKHGSQAHGGTILVIPAILISMTTWHDLTTNKVELLYGNKFGGKVGIRWNLGSIAFLREMWATHARALALRRSHDEQPRSLFEDENLESKLKDVDLGDKYTYIPLEEPQIEIPQTKDLGEATPPVEWFGVNRNQFPGLTHQAIIVPLQKLAHIAEYEWARIFGHA